MKEIKIKLYDGDKRYKLYEMEEKLIKLQCITDSLKLDMKYLKRKNALIKRIICSEVQEQLNHYFKVLLTKVLIIY